MKFQREIGEKGQVVIPKDIRKSLGLKKGSRVIFEVKTNEVVLKPEMDAIRQWEEFLNVPKRLKKPIGIKEIKKILDEKYDLP